MNETMVGRIYGQSKFWVRSGTEMEWCIVKVMIMMMMMMMMNRWEEDEMTVTPHRQVGEVLGMSTVTPALWMLYHASQALQIYHENILLMKINTENYSSALYRPYDGKKASVSRPIERSPSHLGLEKNLRRLRRLGPVSYTHLTLPTILRV